MTRKQLAIKGFAISLGMTIVGFCLHYTAVTYLGRNGLFLSSALGVCIGTCANVIVNRIGFKG